MGVKKKSDVNQSLYHHLAGLNTLIISNFPLPEFLLWLPPTPSTPCLIPTCPQVELSDGTSHTITDAYAGKEYIIQVAAKDNDIGTWSDWSVAVHATPWTEEPKHLTTEVQITGETLTQHKHPTLRGPGYGDPQHWGCVAEEGTALYHVPSRACGPVAWLEWPRRC